MHDARSTVMQTSWVEWTTVQTDVQSIEKATFSFFFIFTQKKKMTLIDFSLKKHHFLIDSNKSANLNDLYEKSYIYDKAVLEVL